MLEVKPILERIDRTGQTAEVHAPTPAAPMLIYVINLDRSMDRWERMRNQAVKFGLNIVRVPAIDGRVIADDQRADFEPRRFFQYSGRAILGGEYGCYRSHLRALETFVASGDPSAIIMEDDVDLNASVVSRALACLTALRGDAVVKLANHRKVGFRPLVRTSEGDVLGRCQHGPQGSAACYAVTRKAAQTLLSTMKSIRLPYDVALERGWSTAVDTFSVEENLIEFSPYRKDTTIGNRADYRAVKPHFLLRTPAHCFRTYDQIRRWLYAMLVKP